MAWELWHEDGEAWNFHASVLPDLLPDLLPDRFE